MPEKITYTEFAAKIKGKYPQYKDVDDYELANKIIGKYPQYKETVDLKKKAAGDYPSETFSEESRISALESELEAPSISQEKKPEAFDYDKYEDVKELAMSGDRSAALEFADLDKQRETYEQTLEPKEEISYEEARNSVNDALSYTRDAIDDNRIKKFREMFPNELPNNIPGDTQREKNVNALIEISGRLKESEVYNDPRYNEYRQEYDAALNPEMQTALNISSSLKESIKKIDEAKETGILKQFGKGVSVGIEDYIVDYVNLGRTIRDNQSISSLENKIKRIEEGSEEDFTDGEKALIKSLQSAQQASQAIDKELPEAYRIGSMLGQAIGFMLEFGLTSGAGAGVKRKLMKEAVKRGATSKAAKVSLNLTDKLARSGIQTAAMPTFYKDVAKNVAAGESVPLAVGNAFYDNFVEAFSERLFVGKIPTGGMARNIATEILQKAGQAVAGAKGFKGVVKGIGGEYVEEKFAEAAHALKDEDTFEGFFKKFIDPVENMRTLTVTGIISGTMGGTQEAIRGYASARLNSQLKTVGDLLPSGIKANIDEILTNEDLSPEEIITLTGEAVRDAKVGGQLNEEEAKNVLVQAEKYAVLNLSRRAMDEASKPSVKPTERPLVEPSAEVTEEAIAEPQAEEEVEEEVVTPITNKELDADIEEAQQRLNLPTAPDVDISDNTETTLDKIDAQEPVTNDLIKSASDELYSKYKELEAMKASDTRQYTTDQIESMQEFIGEEITKLEDYATRQKETGEFVSETEASQIAERRATEIEEEIQSVKTRQAEIDKELLADITPERRKELTSEFGYLNKQVSKLNKEAEGLGVQVKTVEPIVQAAPKKEVAIEEVSEEAPVIEQPTKKEIRKERIDEIDAELGDALSDIADIIGAKKSLTGEQRKKLAPTVFKVGKLLAEKYALKGQDLIDEVISYFKAKNIDLDEDIINQLKEQSYAKSTRETPKEAAKEEEGMERGKEEEVPVRDNEKDRLEAKPSKIEKQAGFQERTIEKKGGIYRDIANKNKVFYNQRNTADGIDRAVEWLSEREDDVAYNSLKKAYGSTRTVADRQTRRQLFMAKLANDYEAAVKSNDTEKADVLLKKMDDIQVAASQEFTATGQGSQVAVVWRMLSDNAVTYAVNREIEKYNEKKAFGADVEELSKANEKIAELSKRLSEEAIKNEKLQAKINEIADKYKKRKTTGTNKEKAKEVADKLRKIKSSNWGITLAAEPLTATAITVLDGAIEITAKTIEVSGDIADAISKGIAHIKKSDWYKGLKSDQKRKIERQFQTNVKKDLGVDKLTKKDIESFLKQEVKDLKTSLNKIIKEHWRDLNIAKRKLSERIIDDLGLDEADARKVEDTVLNLIKEQLNKESLEFLSKEIGTTKIPERRAKSKFIDKLGQLIMMGALDSDLYRELFAEKFGLKSELTGGEAKRIMDLHKAVVESEGMGSFSDIAADAFAKEIDRLIPESISSRLLKAMIGLDYANMLSGATTHGVNLSSAMMNLVTRPIAEATDWIGWIEGVSKGIEQKSIPALFTNSPLPKMMEPWLYFLEASGYSVNEFLDVLNSGDIRAMHKYISEVSSSAKLSVPELERELFGKDRFSSELKWDGKKILDIKINPANFAKYVGRLLAAEDAAMYRGFEAVELAAILRDKMKKQGHSESEIQSQIQRQVFGKGLSAEERDDVEKQLEREKQIMNDLGFKTDSRKQKKRRLEIIREKLMNLTPEEELDIKEAARGEVFNDTRGGIVNSMIKELSKVANKNVWTKLAIMPYFAFFKIFGNIGDFVIDTIPLYGSARARGASPTSWIAHYEAYKKKGFSNADALTHAFIGDRIPQSELPFRTAQLGLKGTRRYEQQLRRARLGNLILIPITAIIAGAWAMGDDDEGNPWFDISGARLDIRDRNLREQQEMPPYTIKLGKYKTKYQNKPVMMFAASLLGHYRDMQRAGYSDEEVSKRMSLLTRAFGSAFSTLTELQIAGGIKDLSEFLSDFLASQSALRKDANMEEASTKKQLDKFGKYVLRKQASPFVGWLPTRNNLFQQTIQFIEQEGKESRDITAILNYDLGIHHWTNKTAIDVFGKPVYKLPGYTQIAWPSLLKKKDPERWEMVRFLSDNNALPSPVYNRDQIYVDPKSEDGYRYETPSEDEFYEYRKLMGTKFYNEMVKYKDSDVWQKDLEIKHGQIVGTKRATKFHDKVSDKLSEAKSQTKAYLYTWGDMRGIDKKTYDRLYEVNAMPQLQQTVKVYDTDGVEVFTDEYGDPIVVKQIELDGEVLAKYNADSFEEYMKLMKDVNLTNNKEYKIVADAMWKSATATVNIDYTINLAKHKAK